MTDTLSARKDTLHAGCSTTPPLLPASPLLGGDDADRPERGEDGIGLADQGGDGIFALAFLNGGDGLGGSAPGVVDQIRDGITGDELGGEAVGRVEQNADRFGLRIGREDRLAEVVVGSLKLSLLYL